MKIVINVEGVEVEGAILHRTSRDIAVEITSPYQGLQVSSHIPYFMTPASFSGPFGDMRAKPFSRICIYADVFYSRIWSRLGRGGRSFRRNSASARSVTHTRIFCGTAGRYDRSFGPEKQHRRSTTAL